MDYTLLEQLSYKDLKEVAQTMDIPIRRGKVQMLQDIKIALQEFESYKTEKLDKYERICPLGNPGTEGRTYLVKDSHGREYAMKTFRKQKSTDALQKQVQLQKIASDAGVAPNIIDVDTVSKYIVMEKMDRHLLEVIRANEMTLSERQQRQIISIFKKLDNVGIFHGDANLDNYMYRGSKLYVIDFGHSRNITSTLTKKLGTSTPNLDVLSLGIALKLREFGCSDSSYSYITKYLSDEQKLQFGFNLKKRIKNSNRKKK